MRCHQVLGQQTQFSHHNKISESVNHPTWLYHTMSAIGTTSWRKEHCKVKLIVCLKGLSNALNPGTETGMKKSIVHLQKLK